MKLTASFLFTMLCLILTTAQAYDSEPYRWNEYRGSGYRDTDHDGVRDFRDVCPRSNPGSPVDSNGCHYGFPFEVADHVPVAKSHESKFVECHVPSPEKYSVNHVAGTFIFDSSKLTPEIKQGLTEFQASVNARKMPFVAYLTGFADPRGTVSYNQGLGWHRALAVKAFLVNKGWLKSRISIRGAGEDGPSSLGLPSIGRYVEIRIQFGECVVDSDNDYRFLSYDEDRTLSDTDFNSAKAAANRSWRR